MYVFFYHTIVVQVQMELYRLDVHLAPTDSYGVVCYQVYDVRK